MPVVSYPEYVDGMYNDPRCHNHEWAQFSDGVFCRKCYAPSLRNALESRVAALEGTGKEKRP